MEWLGTQVESSPAHGTVVLVDWMDPTKEFLEAVSMSALNRVPMPIPNDPLTWSNALSGYVIEYSWAHEAPSTVYFGSNKTIHGGAGRVRLTVRFQVLP